MINMAQGNRAALPSASIMLKQPLSAFRGQVNICILSVVTILTSIRHLNWKFNARRCEILKDKWYVTVLLIDLGFTSYFPTAGDISEGDRQGHCHY